MEPLAPSQPPIPIASSAVGIALTPEQFGAQFRSSFSLFWTIAAAIAGNPSLADDIVQEAAVVAIGKINDFTSGTNFNAWMAQTVRFVALNAGRKEQKRRATHDDSELDEAPARSAAQPIEVVRMDGTLRDLQRSFDDRVLGALGTISEVARACLLLRTVHDLEYSEISALLEIPEGTAMSHVHRSRQKMREQLEKEMAADGWRLSDA